jgi:hypothetical protein
VRKRITRRRGGAQRFAREEGRDLERAGEEGSFGCATRRAKKRRARESRVAFAQDDSFSKRIKFVIMF